MKPNPFIKNRPCVYGLRNLVNGKIYVGRTICIHRRCSQYISDFKHRRTGHLNDHLYRAMLKAGLDNFEMFPLEFCDASNLKQRELHWMLTLKSCERDRGYNLRQDADGGMVTSVETRSRISENLKRQWAAGVRSQHGEKLKARWASDPKRRSDQSALLSEIKTRWVYHVTCPAGSKRTVNYAELRALGLGSALSNFSKRRVDETVCNGHKVVRKIQSGSV